MSRRQFYHGTTKKLIVAFGTIFRDIRIVDGFDREITIPLNFAQKEKWLELILSRDTGFAKKTGVDIATYDTTLPRMAFEIVNLSFASERAVNPLSKISDITNTENGKKYMLNRVPYDYMFDLNIAATRFEDIFKIQEQIIPFFVPELNLTINDMEDFDLKTNIPVILNSISLQEESEGDFNQKRVVSATMSFTVKAYLYSDIRTTERIRKTVMDLTNTDFDSEFDRMTSEIVPPDALKNEPHEIVDTVTTVRKTDG